jgi:hypothetical protein
MKVQLAPGLTIKPSRINGRGCCHRAFPRGKKIAEYAGERISDFEATKRSRNRRILRICYVSSRWSLDGACGGNGTHYINHSEPNAYMKNLYGHVLFFACAIFIPAKKSPSTTKRLAS